MVPLQEKTSVKIRKNIDNSNENGARLEDLT